MARPPNGPKTAYAKSLLITKTAKKPQGTEQEEAPPFKAPPTLVVLAPAQGALLTMF